MATSQRFPRNDMIYHAPMLQAECGRRVIHGLTVRDAGAALRGPQKVPTGRNLTAVHPGGIQVEYVEWSPAQWERARREDS